MLAVVKDKPKPGVTIKDVPEPTPKPGEVLVEVIYASICGTDIGIYDWIPWAEKHIKPPTIIGHEIVGEIVEINGDSSKLQVGDLVSSETHIFCDRCDQCRFGNYHICENMQLFGISRDGSFAEYATIPIRTTWKNDKAIPVEHMSVQEPLGNAMHAVSKSQVGGRRVLVLGLGPVGLCATAIAKANSPKELSVVEPQKYRRDLLKEFAGVSAEKTYSDRMNDHFDIVFEMSGAVGGIESAFDAVRPGGTVVAFGIPKDRVVVPWGDKIIGKEIQILSVFGRKIWDTWKATTDFLKSGEIDISKIITHEFELKDFEKAMTTMKSGKSGKIILAPGAKPRFSSGS